MEQTKTMSAEGIAQLRSQMKVARDEIRNLRKSVEGLKHIIRKDRDFILKLLAQKTQTAEERIVGRRGCSLFPTMFSEKTTTTTTTTTTATASPTSSLNLDCLRNPKPIGIMKSVFVDKNGTPRQPSLVAESRGSLRISKDVFNNPSHSLLGLEKYSHAWILFAFHKNSNVGTCGSAVSENERSFPVDAASSTSLSPSLLSSSSSVSPSVSQFTSSSSSSSCSSSSTAFTKAKVHPPRLGGAAVGVFACRSPHRPNPIGLTLAKIEKISDDKVEFSGIDLIDGTPVLDLKPYIPDYDQPKIKRRKVVGQRESDDGVDDSIAISGDGSGGDGVNDSIAISGDGSGGDGVKGYDVMNNDGGGDVAVVVSLDCLAENEKKGKTGSNLKIEDEALATPKTAEWLQNANQEDSKFNVLFTPVALEGLEAAFQSRILGNDGMNDDDDGKDVNDDHKNERFDVEGDASRQDDLTPSSASQLKSLVRNILKEDPRSVYRKTKCREMLYFSRVSGLHVTSWFDDDNKTVTVLKIS